MNSNHLSGGNDCFINYCVSVLAMSRRVELDGALQAVSMLLGQVASPRGSVDDLKSMISNVDELKLSDSEKNLIKLLIIAFTLNRFVKSSIVSLITPVPLSRIREVEDVDVASGCDNRMLETTDTAGDLMQFTVAVKLRGGEEYRMCVALSNIASAPPQLSITEPTNVPQQFTVFIHFTTAPKVVKEGKAKEDDKNEGEGDVGEEEEAEE